MPGASAKARLITLLALAAFLTSPSSAQTTPSPPQSVPQRPAPGQKLTITVTDENGVAVDSARVFLQGPPPVLPLRCATSFAGRCEFTNLSTGAYALRVEKEGFYAASVPVVDAGVTANVDVTLSHQHETREVVNVVESAPAIDPAQISTKEELTGTQIVDIPYPATHDYRNALNFVPGVTPDGFGQPHLAGAESYQTLVLLDGFNVTQPANGVLLVRTSVDSFRSLEVTPSREPAEYGKGSGGVLALNTKMGDDHFRVSATDFLPGLQNTKGINLGQWTPIYTMSGPVRKGKVWFIDALEGEYNNAIIRQLPSSSDEDHIWRVDNLAKMQSNLTARHLVTASFLSNFYYDQYAGLSFLQPQPTTPSDSETAYIGSVKDQYYFRGGALLETGFGVDQYTLAFTPHGAAPYILTTDGSAGNYYLRENTLSRRVQGITNLYLPQHQWHGRHDIKIGGDVDRVEYDAAFARRPISFLQPEQPPEGQVPQPCPTDASGIPQPSLMCARYSTFFGGNYSGVYNVESSAYFEDRWLVTNRLLIEPGLRFDWDQVVRVPLFSPRLAGTYTLDSEGNTKLSAGVGIVYDGTSMGLIAQPFAGERRDYFFDATTGNVTGPALTAFAVNRNALTAPRYLNWSVGLEKKLPAAVFLKVEFLEKRGTHGFAYNTQNGMVDGNFFLQNGRRDSYDAIQISARHRFHQQYEIFGSYTRSRSHTNQVFDFGLDLPVLSSQLPGPYPWDTPNRFVGWGIVPFFKVPILHKMDLVYSAEARTGLPVLAITSQGEIPPADPPGRFRLPAYYSVNVQFEKRFHLFGRYWALRGGFDNVTNHANTILANGIVDPPTRPSPTFVDGPGRGLTGRLRYLGRQ